MNNKSLKNKKKNKQKKYMDQIHDNLMSKGGLYHFWHQNKFHKFSHWALFILVAILFTALLTGEIQKPE